MIIGLDFDGTLIDHVFPAIAPLRPEWKPILDVWHTQGHTMFIWTCRNSPTVMDHADTTVEKQIALLKQWTKDNQVEYLEVDEGKVGKRYADIYIDDKALRFQHNIEDIGEFVDLLHLQEV